jgi:lipoprotein NlpD
MRAWLRWSVLVGAALLLAACASRRPAPVTERTPAPPPVAAPAPSPAGAPGALPPREAATDTVPGRPDTHVVRSGDTLGRIAQEYGLSWRDIAAWNGIENPNLLRVGQVLRLRPPGTEGTQVGVAAGGVVTAPLPSAPPPLESGAALPGARGVGPAAGAPAPAPPSARGNSESYKTEPRALRQPYSEQAVAQIQRAVAGSAPAAPASASPAPRVAAAAPAASAPPGSASTPGAGAVPGQAPTPGPGAAAASGAAGAPGAASAPPPAVAAPADGGKAADPDEDALQWIWPATGKVLGGFSETATLKGIDIAGRMGQPVVASADGRVVYAGSGLRGYGKLVIIKHNKTYLSAYAHNSQIAVAEGQQVRRGQKIAEMGNTDADQVKLHFEIRRLGRPVDPTRYLPPG